MDRLFAALIDDASLFPPASLPMPTAVAEHRRHRHGYPELVSRFLCPASRLQDLRSDLAENDRFDVGVILNTGVDDLRTVLRLSAADPRLRLTVLDMPVPSDGDRAAAVHQTVHALAKLPQQVSAFVELPRMYGWRDALSLVAARGYGAKLRTGGMVADAFPTEIEVAEFVRACVAEGAPFKCTAGLHHAVRQRDDRTGFEHQGFLNILLATHAAADGASVDELTAILAEHDPASLVEQIGSLDAAAVATVRQHFVGFGTCSVDEPIDDLSGLGLIEKREPAAASMEVA